MKAKYRPIVLGSVELVSGDLFRVKSGIFANSHNDQFIGQFRVQFAGACFIDTNQLRGGKVKRELLRKNCYQIRDCTVLGN